MVSIRPRCQDRRRAAPQLVELSPDGKPHCGSWLVQQALNASSSPSWRGKRTSRCLQVKNSREPNINTRATAASRPAHSLAHPRTSPNHLVSSHTSPNMASLKRSIDSDPLAASISSKVYVRSTKSGKVQKIVREVYLRQDIPCSSKLCHGCAATTPRDASGRGAYSDTSNPRS